MESTFSTKILKILKDYCEKEHSGNVRATAESLGMDPDSGLLGRWFKQVDNPAVGRSPTLSNIGPVMDRLGITVVSLEERQTRNEPSITELESKIAEQEQIIAASEAEKDRLINRISFLNGEISALERHIERLSTAVQQSTGDEPNKRTA